VIDWPELERTRVLFSGNISVKEHPKHVTLFEAFMETRRRILGESYEWRRGERGECIIERKFPSRPFLMLIGERRIEHLPEKEEILFRGKETVLRHLFAYAGEAWGNDTSLDGRSPSWLPTLVFQESLPAFLQAPDLRVLKKFGIDEALVVAMKKHRDITWYKLAPANKRWFEEPDRPFLDVVRDEGLLP